MAQFDVYPNPSKTSKAHYPYLVDIQSSLLNELVTRIVIPLGTRSAFAGETLQGLTPEISFKDQEFLLLTPQISSVSEKHLKNPVGSLSHFRNGSRKLDSVISASSGQAASLAAS